MEIIELSGYTEEEKLEIAKRYLVPRQIERNGLTNRRSSSPTRRSRDHRGLHARGRRAQPRARDRRGLPQGRARVRRGHAQDRAHGRARKVEELLGQRRFQSEVERARGARRVTGLAWTPVGGDVLFVEATAYPGKGKLTITGQLGDVMKESASAALSYLKANAWRWGKTVDPEWFREHDLHVHVPAGAVPKDGPSAGITMATALVSLVTGRPVRRTPR